MGLAAKKLEPKKSFADALKATKKTETTTAKAKSKVPVLETPDDIKQHVDRYVEAKQAEKVAKAEKEDAGDTLISFVSPYQDKDGFKGDFRHSYGIPGTDGNQVKYVSSNRFSINSEDAEQIREILGDSFDELIDEGSQVNLKPEVLEDEALQDELMELVGDRFAEFFETVTQLSVKDDFDKNVYRAVDEEKRLAELRTFCRPYKPSLR